MVKCIYERHGYRKEFIPQFNHASCVDSPAWLTKILSICLDTSAVMNKIKIDARSMSLLNNSQE